MTEHPLSLTNFQPDADGLITLAILAVGGQGGGQLTDWIVELAEANGYRAQSTSVPGVAQRTGATVYYIEMAPDRGGAPVFALMPAPGDLDIVIAAELMEAGRAVTRGFVTPLRTTLIASTHRVLAISEKLVPGDGRLEGAPVMDALEAAANRCVALDLQRMAQETGSHITACLLGALAGSGVLPFPREAFEAVVRGSGRGVQASLMAFARAYDGAQKGEPPHAATAEPPRPAIRGPEALQRRYQALTARLAALPEPVRALAGPGLEKVVDYQDLAYGAAYLDRVEAAVAKDSAARDWAYATALAKHLANALCYDDIIRVADLKTRAARFGRVGAQAQASPGDVLAVTEYMHPRGAEICGLMPRGLGRRVETSPRLSHWLDRAVNKGRRYRSDRLPAFLMLHALAGMRPWRRRLWRDETETQHREAWLALADGRLAQDYDLAVQTLIARRLIKGYSDTHSRGLGKFDLVLKGMALVEGRADAADWARRLITAALGDAEGEALRGTLATIRSFA
ncbi:indolepyruvate oxidoreductase subunit beta family protein [Pararhodobacter sp. CCB-MM2]|uniref:indolepyruvate oxidoreductase subunit beta family protein n=1 Tax=Pararhodobacter sp. CCB-MM2 TaxID=1786003 RepID=UPI00082B352D|nr:indolepyruvate oxidoreductase subunit beta family protein [Pararhodobacter sp. CCB-MM2]